MPHSREGWAVPDFGTTLHRERICSQLDSCGSRPSVIWGPSGCGKSVAAAQFCARPALKVTWIHADGAPATSSRLATAIARAIGEWPPHPGDFKSHDARFADVLDALAGAAWAEGDGTDSVVVLDDVGSTADSSDTFALGQLGRILWRRGVRLIITTRDLSGWPANEICEFSVLGPEHLALSDTESMELLHAMRLEGLGADCEVLREACSGHVAFFGLLATQAQSHGLSETVTRTVSLDAWIGRVLSQQVSPDDRHVLLAAALFKAGKICELESAGIADAFVALSRVSAVLPLVAVGRDLSGAAWFRLHDLVVAFCFDQATWVHSLGSELIGRALEVLSARDDLGSATALLGFLRDPRGVGEWLGIHGRNALEQGHCEALDRAFATIPVPKLLGQPRLLLLSAEVCRELGRRDDALAKSRAARGLAEHSQDPETADEALAQSLRFMAAISTEDAARIAQEILSQERPVRGLLRAEALLTIGRAQLHEGNWDGATHSLSSAAQMAQFAPGGHDLETIAAVGLALIPCLAYGDFVSTHRKFQPLVDAPGGRLSFRVSARGNMSVALLEMGRLDRCDALLKSSIDAAEKNGLDDYLGAFVSVRACSQIARGHYAKGFADFARSIEKSIASGHESEAAQTRVFLAAAHRSVGEAALSLTVAERAFERLSNANLMQFQRLAALEVAASLLALGDSAAARSWAESVVENGCGQNLYHSLRADMILAEIERLEGDVEAAVLRLSRNSDHVLSENSNWQVAMYCRAFPDLVGMFARAVGVDKLPVHMLRMILPEHAEASLMASRPFMNESSWAALGRRVLGDEGFGRLVARKGQPLCHVRMFGGLEVSVGGRMVRERDWRKRKARLLFAMLVSRRGQDIPRDQLFEYLWPTLDEERAKNNLYVAWSTMKSVLMGPGETGPCPYVESVGGVCRTIGDAVQSDIEQFEHSLLRARDAENEGRVRDALSEYEKMGDLYRGDLLPGDCYDDWFAAMRGQYRTTFVDAMLRATRLLVESGDSPSALAFVRRAIATDPYREDLYQCALRCQIAAGQRSSAIDTYFQLRNKLSEELGLDPSAETRALYDQILAMEDKPRPTPLDPLGD